MWTVWCASNGCPQPNTPKQAIKSLVLNGKFSCKIICKYPFLVSLKETATTTLLSVDDILTKMDLFLEVQDLQTRGLISLSPSFLPSTDPSVVIVTEVRSFLICMQKRYNTFSSLTSEVSVCCLESSPAYSLLAITSICLPHYAASESCGAWCIYVMGSRHWNPWQVLTIFIRVALLSEESSWGLHPETIY